MVTKYDIRKYARSIWWRYPKALLKFWWHRDEDGNTKMEKLSEYERALYVSRCRHGVILEANYDGKRSSARYGNCIKCKTMVVLNAKYK